MDQVERQTSAGDPAQVYEGFFVPAMFAPLAALLLERVRPRPGESVLDVACGTGIVARRAAPFVGRNGSVVGLDPSPQMLAVARSASDTEGVSVEWREGRAEALPFPDDSFDPARDRAWAHRCREDRPAHDPGGAGGSGHGAQSA